MSGNCAQQIPIPTARNVTQPAMPVPPVVFPLQAASNVLRARQVNMSRHPPNLAKDVQPATPPKLQTACSASSAASKTRAKPVTQRIPSATHAI